MNNQTPKLFSTVVPGNMDLEEWSAGGFSTYIHGDGSCNKEVEDAIKKFKSEIFFWMALELPGFTDDTYIIQESLEKLIDNYKP